MKFPYSWLKELSKTTLSPQKIAERLTMLGLEVESLTILKAEFSGVVVGKVLDVKKVEGTDHLKVCQVTTGDEPLQIVCGAPNVEAGQKVPVATVGATLPGDFKIKKAKLRGVESHGMICSGAELGISNDASGILVLDDLLEIGVDFKSTLPTNEESVFELSITPNRPDCLGVYGIARELCASENRPFAAPKPAAIAVSENPEKYPIGIEAPEDCPRYTARIISNVRVGKSPHWLVERLAHAGMRSINNIVDITNYIMLATGQPLHAFDLDKLKNGKIIVRHAANGEEFMTLDGKLHKLDNENLLICDGELPVAIAGVMGGENSEVDLQTQNVLLESAYFSPISVRKTAKKLAISTEASKRFERGVDPNGAGLASDAATEMLCQYAHGEATSKLLDAYPNEIARPTIDYRPARADVVIGEQIPLEATHTILTNLGCDVVEAGDCLRVRVPTYRPDLTREIDLIEEVARVYGYDKVAPTQVDTIRLALPREESVSLQDKLKQSAVEAGLSEIITFSFISAENAAPFIENESSLVKLRNPLSEEMSVLRPSLLASMLPAVSYNVNRKFTDLRFFELGSAFTHASNRQEIDETLQFAGLLTGKQGRHSWEYAVKDASFFDLKGILEATLEQVDLPVDTLVYSPIDLSAFRYAAKVELGKEQLGVIGQLHPKTLAKFDIEKEVFGIEIAFDRLQAHFAAAPKQYKPISQYPFVERDLAIVVAKTEPAASVMHCIRKAGGELLQEIQLFDIYTGKPIAADKKSLALSLRFQSDTKTLTDSEVEGAIKKILSQLEKELEATLRQ